MSDRRRLGVQDALWLEMDRPNNLMVVDSVIWTSQPLDWDRVSAVLQERLCDRYPVFRSVAVRDADGSWWWQEDEAFSFDERVTTVELDDPDDPRSLQHLAARHRTEMLDRDKPLWRRAVRRPLPRRQRHRAAHPPRAGRRHAHGPAVHEPVRRRRRGRRGAGTGGHPARRAARPTGPAGHRARPCRPCERRSPGGRVGQVRPRRRPQRRGGARAGARGRGRRGAVGACRR